MGREMYDSLHNDPGLLGDVTRMGRARRRAHDMAHDEYLDGVYVDEAERTDTTQRMAAADTTASTTTTYATGPWRVRLEIGGDGATVTQQAGPHGATLVVGDQMVPLQPHQPTAVTWTEPPPRLVLLGPRGRRWRLEPA